MNCIIYTPQQEQAPAQALAQALARVPALPLVQVLVPAQVQARAQVLVYVASPEEVVSWAGALTSVEVEQVHFSLQTWVSPVVLDE